MSNKLTPLTPTISAIKLPDGITDTFLGPFTGRIGYYRGNNPEPEFLVIPQGFSVLGPVSELTPEQKAEIVESQQSEGYTYDGPTLHTIYRNYLESEEYWKLKCDQCSTVDESFSTLLQSKRVYTVNPFPDPRQPQPMCRDCADENGSCPNRNGAYCNKAAAIKQYDEAQPYVGNWILIKKEVEK